MKCRICGIRIKPWFDECYECNSIKPMASAKIPEPIIAKDFMRQMGISGW